MLDLRGNIPTEVGLMTSLTTLHLSYTNLSGPIPTELGLLSNLNNIEMHDTRMVGTMPGEICALGVTELTADCTPVGAGPEVACSFDCCSECGPMY